jgi:hypothetical protein
MSLLDDLLHEFPDLAPRRDELARIIAVMKDAGPPPGKLDDAFVQRLRAKLMTPTSPPSYSFFPFMQQRTFSVLVAVLAIAVILPTGYALWKTGDGDMFGTSDSSITFLEAGAFGNLSSATAVATADGKGGGFGASESPLASSDKLVTGESFVSEPFPYERTVYIYTYAGDLASYLTEATATVYERQPFAPLRGSALSDIASAFSKLNIGAFLSGDLTSFVLSADDYMLSVDTQGNTWSIYKNWSAYIMPEAWSPMTANDLPADDVIFDAARNFVATWGIDVSSYGEPVIAEPEFALARAGATDTYIPESATVLFPTLVEHQLVYPSWSTVPTGLRISVNLRDLTITNAYDALSQAYDASSYDLTQDAYLVEKLVAGGGYAPTTHEGIALNEIVVELNDPERVLMEYTLYENGASRTLFIPALRFTLKNPSELPWTSGVITIPLVKDIAETQANSEGNGGVVWPLIK